MNRRTFLTITLVAPAVRQAAPKAVKDSSPSVPWTQWGGPHRNFHTEAKGLKDTWPATGPRVICKRPLGEGYSSTAVENGVLYTMFKIAAKAPLLTEIAWTPPVLVGTRVYLRDRRTMMAVDSS